MIVFKYLLGLLALLLAACSAGPLSVPTPTPGRLPTVIGAPIRNTLPPTWTPTYTPSPTNTPTPSITPSPTTTPSSEDICEALEIAIDLEMREIIAWESGFQIAYVNPWPTMPLQFLAVNRRTGENLGVQLPPGQVGLFFSMNALPGPGIYDWALSLVSEEYGSLCTREGIFTARPPEPTATPDPEATAEITPEVTAEATAELTPEVTAEATPEAALPDATEIILTLDGSTSP
jgi:hypothetical protein